MRVDFTVETRAIVLKSRSVSVDLEDLYGEDQLDKLRNMDECEVSEFLHSELFGEDLSSYSKSDIADAVKEEPSDWDDLDEEDITDITLDFTDGPWYEERNRDEVEEQVLDQMVSRASVAVMEQAYRDLKEGELGDLDDEDLIAEAVEYGVIEYDQKIKLT